MTQKVKLVLVLLAWPCLFSQSFQMEVKSIPANARGVVGIQFSTGNTGEPKLAHSISVRGIPNPNAPTIAVINTWTDLRTCKFECEGVHAIVFDENTDWVQVQIKKGAGWVSKKEVGPFVSIKSMSSKFDHLTTEWDQLLFVSSTITSKSTKIALPYKNARPAAKLLGSLKSNGRLWFNIRLLKNVQIGDAANIEHDLDGWVPAYSSTGNLIMWLFPCGC